MKKLYVAVILSLLCIAFTGCGKKNEEAGKTVEAENETETEKDDDSEVTQDDTESGKNESGGKRTFVYGKKGRNLRTFRAERRGQNHYFAHSIHFNKAG